MYISKNSYRVLGVPSNASLKDIQRNISKLKAFAKIGKEMQLDYDFSCLNFSKINRTDDLLLKSESQIKLDKNRIQMSLFWFIDVSPIDSVALANIFKGDISKSIDIWEKSTKSELTSKNYSAFNNLSTLLLLSTLDESNTDTFKKDSDSIKIIKQALQLKNKFISSTFFNKYCESICKSTSITSDDAQEFFTSTILELFEKNFTAKDFSCLFEGLDNQLKDTLNASLTDTPLSNIQNHIDNAADLIKKDEKSGVKVGKELIKNTKKEIQNLKEILGIDDFQFQTISDSLANQILQCGIVCFNSTENDQEYLSSYKYALKIAVDERTITRAKECIKHCEEEKEANVCSSCKVKNVNRSRPFETMIYKETWRSGWFEQRQVKFQQMSIKIYFCDVCMDEIESQGKTMDYINIGIAIIIAIIIGSNVHWIAGIVAGFISFGIIAWILGILFSGTNATKSLDQHPTLNKYISDGWQFDKPEA